MRIAAWRAIWRAGCAWNDPFDVGAVRRSFHRTLQAFAYDAPMKVVAKLLAIR